MPNHNVQQSPKTSKAGIMLGENLNSILSDAHFWEQIGVSEPKNKKSWFIAQTGFSQRNIYHVFAGLSNINLLRAEDIASCIKLPLWALFCHDYKSIDFSTYSELEACKAKTIFSNKVRWILYSKELEQKEGFNKKEIGPVKWLEKKTGVTFKTLYHVINDTSNVTLSNACLIADALEYEFYTLLTPTIDDLNVDINAI